MSQFVPAPLKSFSFLSSFSDDEIDRLIPFLDKHSFLQDDVIVPEGSQAGRMYFVLSGAVSEEQNIIVDLGISGVDPQKELCSLNVYPQNEHVYVF